MLEKLLRTWLLAFLLTATHSNAQWLQEIFSNNLQSPIETKPVQDIPPIGLGLWNSKGKSVGLIPGELLRYDKGRATNKIKATKAVEYALDAGYTHFDSAAAYGQSLPSHT